MSNILRYEMLPDHDLYRDVYATFGRIVARDNGMLDDALDRITNVREQSRYNARVGIANYTVNLRSASPNATELTQHRSFIAGFSQGVSVGKLLFKADHFAEHPIAWLMERLIVDAHADCHEYHSEELSESTNVAYYSHSLAHLGEEGMDLIGPAACQTVLEWSEQVYPESMRDKNAYVLGHFVTALTVYRHQEMINHVVRQLSEAREAI